MISCLISDDIFTTFPLERLVSMLVLLSQSRHVHRFIASCALNRRQSRALLYSTIRAGTTRHRVFPTTPPITQHDILSKFSQPCSTHSFQIVDATLKRQPTAIVTTHCTTDLALLANLTLTTICVEGRKERIAQVKNYCTTKLSVARMTPTQIQKTHASTTLTATTWILSWTTKAQQHKHDTRSKGRKTI